MNDRNNPGVVDDIAPPAAPRLRKRSILIESALTLATIAGLYDLVKYIFYHGYVPLPFVYDTTDTFMDWFNPAYYGNHGHAYSIYHSVYAPLSFVITKVFHMPGCYETHGKDARMCDPIALGAIFAFYIIAAIVAAVAFYRNDRKTAPYRSITFSVCLPMLHGLERGQLVLFAFIFFFAFFGKLIISQRWRAFAIAMMLNMKSYLLFPVLALMMKRDWRILELGAFASIAVYLITLAIVGEGTPMELYENLRIWFNAMDSVVWDQVNYSTTYMPFLQFEVSNYPVRTFIDPRIVDIATIVILVSTYTSRFLAILMLLFAWLYPRSVPLHRIAFFFLMQSFIQSNPGGYGQAFPLFLVFMERWTNNRTGLAIVLAYLLCIPTDYMIESVWIVPRTSWLMGRLVDTYYGLTLGSLVRPGLLMLQLWLLAIDSLIDIHREMRITRPRLWGRAPAPRQMTAA